MRRPRLTPLRIAAILALGLSVMRFNGCMTLQLLDTRAVDLRLLHRGVEPASPEVVIVAIDDASIEAVGRWPWSRATVARLLDELSKAEPAVVGFDIVQSEDATLPVVSGLQHRVPGVDERTWKRIRQELESWSAEDRTLAASVRKSGRVVLGYFFDFDTREPGEPGRPGVLGSFNAIQGMRGGRGERRVPQASAAVRNLPVLESAAAGSGYFNVIPDPSDGLYRRIPLAIRHDDQIALPLALAMLRVYWDDAPTLIRLAEFGVDGVRIGKREIPVAEDGQMLLNYRGPKRTFRHLSAVDVLDGRIPRDALQGKLVLVGVTATAVADVRATPFDGVFPGVEIHATAIDNILRGDFVIQPKWIVLVEILAALAGSLALGLALRWAKGAAGGGVAMALVAAYVVCSQWLFIENGVPLGLMFPVLTIVVVYAAIGVQQFTTEQSEKRNIRDAFGLYLSPELAAQVSERPDLLALGGEKKPLTVLFSDIRNFTSLSEHIAPEMLVELLNTYLGTMTDIVFAHGGTLDKYVGDELMAVWGAPIPQPDHAEHACLAALDMREQLVDLNRDFAARGWPELTIGIGVHTGEMIVGNMGSARRLSYTVIGDNVNIGSRLEGLNKVYGTTILASEQTIAQARGTIRARELDLVQVRGRSQSVAVFEVLGRSDEVRTSSKMDAAFAAGLAAFRAQRWREACDAFERALGLHPHDGPSRLYVERCREHLGVEATPQWTSAAIVQPD